MPLMLQFSSSTALTSGLIRLVCHSQFSHVDIVVPGEGLLGVSGPDKSINDPGGVLIRPDPAWPYQIKRVVTVQTHPGVDKDIITAARSQIGKPFDDAALHAFLSPTPVLDRDWRELNQWFCSEMVIWACEIGGLFPWKLATPMNRVTPNDCLHFVNPFISDDDVDGLLAP